jgi:2-dehydropantoate 2-reductase
MRIAVLGAGGVGGYFGGLLARSGHEVGFLARGAHLDALRERGLEVRTPDGTFTAAVTATADPQDLEGSELAVIAVKSYSLTEVSPAARRLAEKGAVVLPLLNGVEAADRLVASGVPEDRVLGGLAEISAARLGPGVVERRSAFQRIVVGEQRSGGPSERAERIAAAFREAGAEARVSADITADLWRKLTFIASMSAACGLARASIGPVRQAPLGPLLIERAVREVAAVARARGVALAEDMEDKILAVIASMPEQMQPSFLLDLQAGGPTEIDDLSGAVSRLGRLAGVATPVHDVATAALSAKP